MLKDSRAAFPNRIRALVVDSDARFLRSACLMLSLLNFRVATCESPASAVKLLNGRLKDGDVVFIDALRAATCGFDFRGIVERHLFTPVVYFFSFDYKVAGDAAEALRRTVWAATYVIKKPLDAGELCRLWRIIHWSKILLQRGENTLSWLEWPRGNQALPATVQALLPSSSSTLEDQEEEEDDNGCDLSKAVSAGRGRRRKLGDRHDGDSSGRGGAGGSSGHGRGGGVAVRGRPTRSLAEQMNVTEEQESNAIDDVLPSYPQPAQQNHRGVQDTYVQNQQHGRRSLFMPPVPPMLKVPRNKPMIFTDAAGPSSSNVAAMASTSNTSAPALLPVPAYSARVPAPGLPPPVYQQQQPVAAARAGRGWRRKLGDSHDGGSSGRGRGGVIAVEGQPTGRQEQMNVRQGQESNGDDMVPSHQQPAWQNRRGVQATDVQNQQHSRSLFMQLVPQMLSVPHNNPMIYGDAAGPSSSNATAFSGARYISAPALLPPGHQQQQQPMALYDSSSAPPAAAVPTMAATSGHQPPPQFTLNNLQQRDMFAPRRQGGWMGRRCETGSTMLSFQQPPAIQMPMAGGDTPFGASPTSASPNVGAQPEPADSFDDVLGAMMEMDDTFPRSYNAPAKAKLAAMQAALGNSNCSNYNNAGSFVAPQDPAVPTGNQVELGAADIYGSPVESPGPSAMFNGDGDMAGMFTSDHDDENAMVSLDALWNFDDDVLKHPEGQQVAAADSTTAANATGIMSNGGESGGGLGPNWNMGAAADDGLDMLEEYLMDNNASDFLLRQDMNNGHQ